MTEGNFFLFLYVVAFCVPAAISYLLTFPMVRVCFPLDLLDYPESRKTHLKPMPFMGGASLFAAFWLTIAGFFWAVSVFHMQGIYLNKLQTFLEGMPYANIRIFWVFVGACIIWGVGFLDDKFYWTPLQKIAGEVAAALILWRLGIAINLVPALGVMGEVITFGWILLIINAFNLIDSLDGHCTGVALICSFTLYWITQIAHQPGVSFFIVVFAGALFGFLPHNSKPAKIFLGDNGSLLIGYMMAAFTLLCRYDTAADINYATFLIPVIVFGVPLYDTVSVSVVRILRGSAPWKGDRNHFAHRLVKIGMEEKTAVIFSYFTSITLGITALLLTQVNLFGAFLTVMLYFSIIALIAFLEFYAVETIRKMESLVQAREKRAQKTDGPSS